MSRGIDGHDYDCVCDPASPDLSVFRDNDRYMSTLGFVEGEFLVEVSACVHHQIVDWWLL